MARPIFSHPPGKQRFTGNRLNFRVLGSKLFNNRARPIRRLIVKHVNLKIIVVLRQEPFDTGTNVGFLVPCGDQHRDVRALPERDAFFQHRRSRSIKQRDR